MPLPWTPRPSLFLVALLCVLVVALGTACSTEVGSPEIGPDRSETSSAQAGASVVQLLREVPRPSVEEVEALEVRPGEERFRGLAASFEPHEEPDLVQEVLELLAQTEGIPPRNLEEITQTPNLVVLRLTGQRELRFSVAVSSSEFDPFLPVSYVHDDVEERGLLANSGLGRRLLQLYTEDGTPAEIEVHLQTLRERWEARGIEVLEVKAESFEPLAVAVTVPRSSMTSPEAIFTSQRIAREAMLAKRAGMPLERLGVYYRDEQGERGGDLFAVGDSLAVATADDPALLEQKVRERIAPSAEADRVRIDEVTVVEEDGLIVEIRATSLDGDTEMVRRFAGIGGEVGLLGKDPKLRAAASRLYLDGPTGEPLIRRYEDFEKGGAGEWSAPGYSPPG